MRQYSRKCNSISNYLPHLGAVEHSFFSIKNMFYIKTGTLLTYINLII